MKKEKSPKQASQLGTQLWVSVSRFTKGKCCGLKLNSTKFLCLGVLTCDLSPFPVSLDFGSLGHICPTSSFWKHAMHGLVS